MCSTQRCPECDYPKCEGGHTKPDTTPLYIRFADEDGEHKVIVQDAVQQRLDAARAIYRKQYDKGYSLSERGHSEMAQRILDNANAALREAEEAYAAARARGGRTT
jgi:hypothetical protein